MINLIVLYSTNYLIFYLFNVQLLYKIISNNQILINILYFVLIQYNLYIKSILTIILHLQLLFIIINMILIMILTI